MFQQVIHQYKEDHQLSTFKPKAVLFDMDGVLYDSMKNHTYAWQEAMKKVWFRRASRDDLSI